MDTQHVGNRSIVAAWMAAAAAVWLAACADVPPGGTTPAPMPRAGSPEFILPSEAPRAGPLPRPGDPIGPLVRPADPGGRAMPADAGAGPRPAGTPPSPANPAGAGIEAGRAGSTPIPRDNPPQPPPAPGQGATATAGGQQQRALDTKGGSTGKAPASAGATSIGCKLPPCTMPASEAFAGPSFPGKPAERAMVKRLDARPEIRERAVLVPKNAAVISKPAAAAPVVGSKQLAPRGQLEKAKTLDKKLLAPGG